MRKPIVLLFSLVFSVSITALAEDCHNLDGQSEMNECAIKEFQQLDKKLNKALTKYYSRLDAQQKIKIKEAQLAWVKYRDLNCAFESSGADDGSVYPLIYNYCLSRKTNVRLKELDYLFTCEEGDLGCPAVK